MLPQAQSAARLRELLARPGLLRMPCCFDALSAKLVQEAGFPLSFMSGFSVAAARLGLPDTGLISYAEMLDQGRNICAAVDLPVIGDADTGYGNTVSVQRTVFGYAQAGFAGLMLEDQLAPKRCGHTRGKEVVERDEALRRLAAAIEAREVLRAAGGDLVIIARTDARATRGLDEAIARARAFAALGADILFVEAPQNVEEMARICAEVPGHTMANLVEQGDTPVLPPAELERLGFKLAAYPLSLLSAAAQAMRQALAALQGECHPQDLMAFKDLQNLVGFEAYDAALTRLEGPGMGKNPGQDR
ncbi:MAG: isocitrate lyase/PEP mutase family protein [Gammaproteobacteria bacterium]|nr:isocitrate lyase/PEP mutase family protein [Gammaproteobacteria bacterium]